MRLTPGRLVSRILRQPCLFPWGLYFFVSSSQSQIANVRGKSRLRLLTLIAFFSQEHFLYTMAGRIQIPSRSCAIRQRRLRHLPRHLTLSFPILSLSPSDPILLPLLFPSTTPPFSNFAGHSRRIRVFNQTRGRHVDEDDQPTSDRRIRIRSRSSSTGSSQYKRRSIRHRQPDPQCLPEIQQDVSVGFSEEEE